MRNLFRFAILGLASTSLLNCTDAADDDIPVDDMQIDRDEGRPLTPPSTDAPEKIVRDYLSQRVGDAAIQLRVVNESQSRGVTHVRFEQVVDGLRVHDSYAKAAVSSRGELLQVIHKLGPSARPLPAQAIDSDALRTALVEYGYGIEPARIRTSGNLTTFAASDEMHRAPVVERVAYRDGRALRVGFLVETWSRVGNQLDYTLVGGDGRIVTAERRTNNDSYKVFVEDPSKGGQTIVNGPGAGNAESPAGWLAGAQTNHNITGPNVRAYLDTDNNNSADSATTTGSTVVSEGNFTATADLTQTPATATNRAVAVQNLFYLNNLLHDRLGAVGFDNAHGNFEGNDPVNAEAQDGGGLDNANFATPTDGSSPRMQMYLWSGTTPAGALFVNSINYGVYPSSFGAAFSATGVTRALAVATPLNGCTAVSGVSDKIAIIDRGTCDFVVKVKNAQAAGARGVVIVNNAAGTAFGPGGTDRKITIPSGMANLSDRVALHNAAALAASGQLRTNPNPALRLDGDLDSDIVFHEYGHGLTWRMIGSMSGYFSGAIGEGASDVLAFLMNCGGAAASETCDDIIGEYAYGDYALGIRRQRYSTYSLTYKDWVANQVHADGEIYAAAMWKVLENYQATGLTANDLLADFVDGMNFTPAAPKPEQMRDGMLQSVGATSNRACLIWRGFANRGIGVGATGALTKGGRSASITQSFTVPASCQ